jgi:hypothetical protein
MAELIIDKILNGFGNYLVFGKDFFNGRDHIGKIGLVRVVKKTSEDDLFAIAFCLKYLAHDDGVLRYAIEAAAMAHKPAKKAQ